MFHINPKKSFAKSKENVERAAPFLRWAVRNQTALSVLFQLFAFAKLINELSNR